MGHANRNKIIVFSQRTSMMNLVEASLLQMNVRFLRLDGSLSLLSRDMVIEKFNNETNSIVLAMSLKAAATGLNLVAANHVVLLDLWWNPSLEDQAIDRLHRIGQQKDITVHRVTMSDSLEDKIMLLQEQKSKFVSLTLGTNLNKPDRGD